MPVNGANANRRSMNYDTVSASEAERSFNRTITAGIFTCFLLFGIGAILLFSWLIQ